MKAMFKEKINAAILENLYLALSYRIDYLMHCKVYNELSITACISC